jgi:predicted enzyme related to lactoylglutathione lyase
MSVRPGQFIWYEIITSDVEAAKSFYRGVVGWETKDAGMPGMAYTLLSAGTTQVGGLMAIPDEARKMGVPPCWTGYILVEDVDRAAARVKAAGGAVHRAAADIPEVGRFAVVADPQGAVFILFKGANGQPPASAAPGTLGHVGWHELYAGDGETAFAFYAEQFGWTKDHAMDMGPMGTYQIFSTGSGPAGGMMTKPKEVPVPFWLYYFNVDAIDAAAARVTKGGGKVIRGAMEVPGGSWIVQCADPQGAMFALVAPKR